MAKFVIKIREEGRGKPSVKRFKYLAEAETFIREYWMGSEYIDHANGFHTDYSTFELEGFSLYDLGRLNYVYEGGDLMYADWTWHSETTAAEWDRPDNGDYSPTYYRPAPAVPVSAPVTLYDTDDVPF